tara:strand:+ start:245 stop:409 length:165 start_codon:yes stop_codon:yes gene_type:complete
MSLFQRRHFKKIAAIAAELDLTESQMNILCYRLAYTNNNFNEFRFREYVRVCNE